MRPKTNRSIKTEEVAVIRTALKRAQKKPIEESAVAAIAQKLIAAAALLSLSAFGQTPSADRSVSAPKSPIELPSPRAPSSPCQPLVEVSDVIAQYGSLTHFKIIRDNFVQGKVCLDDIAKLPPEKAVEIIERTLFANGHSITQIDSDTVEITGTGKSARSIGIPVISDPKALPTHERLVSFVFRFKHREALEMHHLFGQHLSPPQTWTSSLAQVKSNTLLVTERTSVIRRLIDIAKEMDIPDWKKQP